MTVDSDKLHFFYDAQSRPAKVNYNGTIYTYLHNLQGDIVGIIDSSGNLVVEYKYDAWGNLLSTSGSKKDTLDTLNHFRYRGYVYDEETGLYYLRTRLYAPSIGRFLNSDKYICISSFPFHSNAYAWQAGKQLKHIGMHNPVSQDKFVYEIVTLNYNVQ